VQPIFATGLLGESEVQDELKELYDEIKETMGAPVVPNFFKTQAAVSPAVVRNTWSIVKGILCHGGLGRTLNEKILTAISWARHCDYCESAHLAFLKILDVSDDEMELLCGRWDELPDPKEREIIRFAVKCATEAHQLKLRDYESLRRHGLTDEDIAELVAMCAFSNYVNTIASGMKVPTDDAFNKLLGRPLGTP
jgi:uncharacterized peroxidase-related enzyme